jgi:hypothetical protein
MRKILVCLLGGCLLCVLSACGGTDRVEKPANPTPRPKNPTFQGPKTPAGEAAPKMNAPPPPPRR